MKDSVYYKELYERFIDSRKQRSIISGGYYETHHIRPRIIGGTNSKDNLIRLTLKEHYFAHLILAKAYPKVKGLKKALAGMIGMMSYRGASSLSYSLARQMVTIEVPPKNELEYKYFNQHKSMKVLGEEYNVSDMTICKWFKIYEIEAIGFGQRHKSKRPSKEELECEYNKAIQQMEFKSLSKKYGVGISTINVWLGHYKIQRRPKTLIRPPADEMKEYYEREGLTKAAKHYNVSKSTIRRWLSTSG